MTRFLAALMMISTAAAGQAPDKPAAPLKLWRLDCGRLDENKERPWGWQKVPTPTPCFLVGNGDRYLLWDTGVSRRAIGANHPVVKLERTITDQLTQIGVKPEAKLLIGAGDFEALKGKTPPGGSAPTHIQPWIDGTSPVEPLVDDRDVFGDGRVTILMTRGHTPGHSSLLVKLKTGPVILSGDLWFSHSDALRATMPDFNTGRAETIASRDRIARMAEKLDAVIILQHEPADVNKLPSFPTAAE